MKILEHFAKNTCMSHSRFVSDFNTKEVESFCFHLHCIYNKKTKQRFAVLGARKIFPTRKWKFYIILQKTCIWAMGDTVPDFSIKEVGIFCFHLHFIYKGKTKQQSAILKTLKNCSTRKWKFYNIFRKTRIWVMPDTVSDENFCFHLHCIYKEKTK